MLLAAYRLVAQGIGGRTVGELAKRMDYEEFMTWIAYSLMEPFGDSRADWRAALMMAQTANMNRPKGRSPYKASDFLLQFEERETREQTMDEMKLALYARYLAWGGKPTE
jgi:hypothetical protein